MPLNFKIGSNYMYLVEAPDIKNPLIFGEWPFYIINWEFFILILFYLSYLFFTKTKTFNNNNKNKNESRYSWRFRICWFKVN